jgi:hypothetical protein
VAELQLKKLDSAAGPGVVTGSGALEAIVSNVLASQPAHSATIEFAFTCTGKSLVTISVKDADSEISGATGQLACGETIFKRRIAVTTKSRLSFQTKATTFSDGAFAFAYRGDFV